MPLLNGGWASSLFTGNRKGVPEGGVRQQSVRNLAPRLPSARYSFFVLFVFWDRDKRPAGVGRPAPTKGEEAGSPAAAVGAGVGRHASKPGEEATTGAGVGHPASTIGEGATAAAGITTCLRSAIVSGISFNSFKSTVCFRRQIKASFLLSTFVWYPLPHRVG